MPPSFTGLRQQLPRPDARSIHAVAYVSRMVLWTSQVESRLHLHCTTLSHPSTGERHIDGIEEEISFRSLENLTEICSAWKDQRS